MKARLLFVALVSCSSAPKKTAAFPAQCSVCGPGQSDDAPVLVDDGMMPARKDEYGPTFDSHITWTDAEPHIRIGPGFETGAGLVRNHRVRVLLHGITEFGAIGDTHHGIVFLGGDMRLKVSFMREMTLFDLYGVWSVGAVAGLFNLGRGEDAAPIGIAGSGMGLRLYRSVSVEVMTSVVHSFGRPFIAANTTQRQWIPDVAIGLRFDLCSLGTSCDIDPIKQSRTDLTCALYERATKMCSDAQAAHAREALCQNALAAMSTSDRVEPTLARDAVDAFISKLGPAAAALKQKNDCLTGWRTCGRAYECSLAQKGEKPDDHRIYSPYVLELMSALGCNANGLPTTNPDGDVAACGYACEDTIAEKNKAICASP